MLATFLRRVLLGLFAISPVPADATILLFDQERDAGTQSMVSPTSSGGTLPTDYGDYVNGSLMSVPGGFFTYGETSEGFTPDVSLDIFSAAATEADPRVNLWQTGYGDLVNVIFADGAGTAGALLLSVRLMAATGYMVELYGFDLAGFGADYTIAGVSVFAASATLFSEADVLVQGDLLGAPHDLRFRQSAFGARDAFADRPLESAIGHPAQCRPRQSPLRPTSSRHPRTRHAAARRVRRRSAIPPPR